MSSTSTAEIENGSLAGNADSSPLESSVQASPQRPWLIRAGSNLILEDSKPLTLPGSEGSPAYKPVYFSRPFLSKWIGGSQGPAFAQVNTSLPNNRVYPLTGYYVGAPEWNPQFPTRLGENGAILLAGKINRRPSVPWLVKTGASPDFDGEMNEPYNCFVRRSSAQHEYLGRYRFHLEFKQLKNEEVENHLPTATKDLWFNGIDNTRWGTELKGEHETRKAMELLKLPDDDPCKLCFYWEFIECVGYDRGLYDALCSKEEKAR